MSVYITTFVCLIKVNSFWYEHESIPLVSVFVHLSGAVCIPIFLPLTVLFLICVSQSPEASVLQWPPQLPSINQLWDPLASVVLLTWIGLHALLYLMPFGKVQKAWSNFISCIRNNYSAFRVNNKRSIDFGVLEDCVRNFSNTVSGYCVSSFNKCDRMKQKTSTSVHKLHLKGIYWTFWRGVLWKGYDQSISYLL